MWRNLTSLSRSLKSVYQGSDIRTRVARFGDWFDRMDQYDADGIEYDHTRTVNEYYDLCSEFMQFGWSESLHFAPLTSEESLEESLVRHQRLMIEKLELREGMVVADIGCGVGGPMRRVARESGARVVCINNNVQQLEKARRRNVETGLDDMAEYINCNFMDMSVIEPDSFDAGYAIESTCHAPDKVRAFAEIYRILKPGALLWGQEMCMTEKFNPDHRLHRTVKDELMLGIALKEIATFSEVDRAIEAAGFQIVQAADMDDREGQGIPWYWPMESRSGTLHNAFRRTPLGRKALIAGLRMAEMLRFFPKGSAAIVQLMDRMAEAYVAGGKMGIFTPLYCFLARKPG